MLDVLRRWRAVFAIYIQDGLAYRASGLIWILTDAATAVTMPLVWAAAARSGAIQGFSSQDFVLYYLCMLLIGSFVTSHFMWEVSSEIREGIFSTFLIRPISYYQYMLVRNFAWRCVRTSLFAPLFVLLLWAYSGFLGGAHLNFGPEFWLAVVLGHFVSMCFVMALSMLALFIQEATTVFELYYLPMLFLSGQIVPIALLPDWARTLATAFPFYYTTGLPTEILIGRVDPAAAWPLIGVQALWIVGSYLGFRALWGYGMRHYTGVGM